MSAVLGSQDSGNVPKQVPEFVQPSLLEKDETLLRPCKSAYDFYKLFQTDDFVTEVTLESLLYARQRGYDNLVQHLSQANLRCVEAVLLLVVMMVLPFEKCCGICN